MVEIPVTRTNLDFYAYSFSVTTNRAKDAFVFHVTITAKNSNISTNCRAHLELLIRDQNGGWSSVQREPVAVRSLAVHKASRMWNADFTVGPETADYPDLYFVFTVPSEIVANGKKILMPSVEVFELRLTDFVSPSDR